jgi:hypothetical protein
MHARRHAGREVGWSVCLSAGLSVCRSVDLSVGWSVGLSVCMYLVPPTTFLFVAFANDQRFLFRTKISGLNNFLLC